MRRPLRRATALAAAGSLLAEAACFSYRTATAGLLPAGVDVRIELTAEGSTDLERVLGPRIRRVEGFIREVSADGTALVVVDGLSTADGANMPLPTQGPVRIPFRDVASSRVRTLDRRKTWISAAVFGVAFVTVVVLAINKAKSDPTGKDILTGGGTPDARR